jgi:hypothetical protein
MNADTSYSNRIKRIRGRSLAGFAISNASVNEAGADTFSESDRTVRRYGQIFTSEVKSTGQTVFSFGCGCDSTSFTGCGCNSNSCSDPGTPTIDSIDLYTASNDRIVFTISWTPMTGVTDYDLSYNIPAGITSIEFIQLTNSTGEIYIGYTEGYVDGSIQVRIIANTDCGSSSSEQVTVPAPCFLAGSLITMSDGRKVPIEDVRVGDLVMGAFGETNRVLALHRPLLGKNLMCRINNEHSTSNHHPHISVDKKFYSNNPCVVSGSTYGKTHSVIDGDGNTVEMMLHGLNSDRILQMEVGINLMTDFGGKILNTLETYELPEDTQLYNLVVSGSHTYFVDTYAVTGWPREDDFDYDLWTPRSL